MPITHKKGCLITAFQNREIENIAHVVNCKGVMGAGIAAQIRLEFPEVYEEYTEYCKPVPNTPSKSLLGNVLRVGLGGSSGVFNLFAQDDYARYSVDDYNSSKRQLHYPSLMKCLASMSENFLWEYGSGVDVGIPYGMGCGLAGGDWEIVEEMLHYYFDGEVELVIYKL